MVCSPTGFCPCAFHSIVVHTYMCAHIAAIISCYMLTTLQWCICAAKHPSYHTQRSWPANKPFDLKVIFMVKLGTLASEQIFSAEGGRIWTNNINKNRSNFLRPIYWWPFSRSNNFETHLRNSYTKQVGYNIFLVKIPYKIKHLELSNVVVLV